MQKFKISMLFFLILFSCNNDGFLSVTNKFDVNYPVLAKEWDFNKNSDKPSDYTCRSGKLKYWICSECGFEFESKIANRIDRNGYCKSCKKRS